MATTGRVQAHDELKPVVSPPPHERTLNGDGASARETIDLQQLLHGLQAMRIGDFSVRLPRDQVGLAGKIADTFNEIAAANQRMAEQLEQVGNTVGREGRTKQRVKLGHTLGAWGEMETSLNGLIDDLL
ncbi:MAG: hypothetical protein ACREEN_02490, partial [Stellaceae bacterium]